MHERHRVFRVRARAPTTRVVIASARDKKGHTAAWWAARFDHTQLAERLRAAEAKLPPEAAPIADKAASKYKVVPVTESVT